MRLLTTDQGATMKHAYYLSEDLKELETVHNELIETGLKDSNIHVLSDDEASVTKHHMRNANPFMTTNVVRALLVGACIGLTMGGLMMSVPFVFGFSASLGSIPFTLGALFLLGFATWEGGFVGLQKVHPKFIKVLKRVHTGKHLLIVDYSENKASLLGVVKRQHPALEPVYL
jgi:VIT1/CCC1 family predicted Fe2+/Mn2+ transporter